MPTPRDIYNYVVENNKESDFLTAMSLHKGGYSIGEIPDKEFTAHKDYCKLISKAYSLNIDIEDDDIITAVKNKLYVTPFISRKDDDYQIHFLVHQYPEAMKTQFEEAIAKEVVEYMIIKTIIALKLDSEYKIDKYLEF